MPEDTPQGRQIPQGMNELSTFPSPRIESVLCSFVGRHRSPSYHRGVGGDVFDEVLPD
jgi:hypothetical protein